MRNSIINSLRNEEDNYESQLSEQLSLKKEIKKIIISSKLSININQHNKHLEQTPSFVTIFAKDVR
ncbi:MAG: hypothetical protein GF317_03270 [Candidatus Lokiarchaeota archaeon]|nr:hypothetical protein [Candidatus Lokiarchaeota archaeon]